MATPSPTPDTVTLSVVAAPAPASTAPISPPAEPAAPAPAAKPDLGALVAAIALSGRGARYAYGASGPRAFDCSGLVLYAYRQAGLAASIGGGHSGYGMYRWARAHGLTSRSDPRVGDIVVYGRGSHVGIYIGNGLVVSALNRRQGIRVTALRALRTSFTAFIHPQF